MKGKFLFIACIPIILFVGLFVISQSNLHPSKENLENEKIFMEDYFLAKEFPFQQNDYQRRILALAEIAEGVVERGKPLHFDDPWIVQGPNNIPGRINTIATHPTIPGTWMVGFSQGGIFKTTDAGTTWQPIFDDHAFLAISDIVYNPKNPNLVFAATGDRNVSGYPFIGNGIYKSENGGTSWEHLSNSPFAIISELAIHPVNSNILLASSMGTPMQPGNNRGIYRSMDGGGTWNKVLNVSDTTGFIEVTFDPNNPNIAIANGWDRVRTHQKTVFSGLGTGLYKSIDGGISWVKLTNGLPGGAQSRISFTMSLSEPGVYYARYINSDQDFLQLYQSLDYGESWTAVNIDPDDNISGLNSYYLGGQGWYCGKMGVHPYNGGKLYLLGVELYTSIGVPELWMYDGSLQTNGNIHADCHDITWASDTTELIATDGGIYSRKNSNGWRRAGRFPTTQFYRVHYDNYGNNNYVGGAQDNGTRFGRLATFNQWGNLFGADGFQPYFHPEDSLITYVEYQNGEIRVDTSGKNQWLNGNSGFDGDDRRNWDMPYRISTHDKMKLYTGSHRFFVSSGSYIPAWSPISEDLTDGNIYGERFHNITAVAESFVHMDQYYAGTSDGNIWVTKNGGVNWVNITSMTYDHYVSDIECSQTVGDRVFITQTGMRANDFSPIVLRSDNAGASWISIAGDLPSASVNSICIMPNTADSVLFLGTDAGVYGTVNAGQTWHRLGNNMPVIPVYDLMINNQGILIAGTFARSLQTYDIKEITADHTTSSNHLTQALIQVYPNPCIAQCKISGILNTTKIEIRNVYGQLVQNISKKPEEHSLLVPMNTYLPGNYHYAIYQNQQEVYSGWIVKM